MESDPGKKKNFIRQNIQSIVQKDEGEEPLIDAIFNYDEMLNI